ncbi:MAG TPA: M20/M25/M40 family metallo-hydrolase [Candidatus Acidoferrales bacterium]|nr:M20/M25/M40 family metallo-hydrolase [Candidatus Acidoferrales bacterium]
MSFRRDHGLGILFLFAVLLAVAGPLGAQAPAAAQASPAAQAPSALTKASDDAVGWLRELLTINTTNPPGNEAKAAELIKGILAAEGIPAEILEVAPGRGAVVARLRSSALPDPTRALLLLGHLDVVGVDKSKWSVDPFTAVLKDGYIYGRGAIDDKGMVAANLAVFVALKRSGARLDRDVIFLASTDEEQGGDASIKTLIAKYGDKFASGFAINEGGRVMAKDGKVQYVGIQASEKIPYNVAVIATGTSGHASVPRKDNAVVHLAEAVAKIAAYQPPAQPSVIVRRYFEQLAKIVDAETNKWMRALETPERAEHAARVLSDMDPTWNSMLHDSIAPTMLEAGIRANVVPSEARAMLNIRLLPGDLIDPLLAELKKVVNDPHIRFEVQKDAGMTALPSSLDSELYKSIERVSTQEFPDAVVLPYLSTGATDSAQLRLHNVQAYGLLPFPLTEEDTRRMHADDERIPLTSFQKGIEFLYRVVAEFALAK